MIIAKAIEELGKIFRHWNELKFNNKLPEPMIVIKPARKNGTMGTCSVRKVWIKPSDIKKHSPEFYALTEEEQINSQKPLEEKYEVSISGEYLNIPIFDICEIMLHELVHLYCNENGIKDCNGKSHNKEFKKVAESVGLIVEKATGVGYGSTKLSPELEQQVKTFNIDETAFSFVRIVESKPLPKKKGKYIYTLGSDGKKKIKSKYDVVITEKDTGELYDQEYEEGEE